MCKIDTGRPRPATELTAAEAEERRRRANFLCLVGKGREAQGRLVEAFEHYLELGEEAQKDELIQVVDEPSVKAAPDVWSQGRIAAMVANATDAKQKAGAGGADHARAGTKLKGTKRRPIGRAAQVRRRCSARCSASARRPASRWPSGSWRTPTSTRCSRPSST